MTKTKTYRVTFDLDEDGWWIARIHGVAGVHSNGRTLAEARRRVREALSLAVDDADHAVFKEVVHLAAATRQLVEKAKAARARVAEIELAATDAQRRAAKKLTIDLGLSLRAASELLGVSHIAVKKTLDKKPATRR